MAHDAHIRRTELARHVALLRQATPADHAALRDQLCARCYPPPTPGARVNPLGPVPIEPDPEDNRVLVKLVERLWPSVEAQDS